MSREQLKKWLAGKKFDLSVMLVCPRCHRVDIDPAKHLDECDPVQQATRDYDWAESVGDR